MLSARATRHVCGFYKQTAARTAERVNSCCFFLLDDLKSNTIIQMRKSNQLSLIVFCKA